MNKFLLYLSFALLGVATTFVDGFVVPTSTGGTTSISKRSNTALNVFGMGSKKQTTTTAASSFPTFNKETQTWEKAASDNGENPYDAVGALLRHGPAPFIARITNPKNYEQGVLKYMAVAKVSRSEAVGNMDAKLNNAADWQYQKMEESKGRPKVDYTYLDPKQATLVIIWSAIVIPTGTYVVLKTLSEGGLISMSL